MEFIQKRKILFAILSFLFIWLPQYIDTIWSLLERIQQVNEIPFNINWLYVITAPVGLFMLGVIVWQEFQKTKTESYISELSIRREGINSLRRVLASLENRIGVIRKEVEQFPLSHYEAEYLEKIEGYQQFKTKYSSKTDAQYVALSMSEGIGANPEFNARMDSKETTLLLDELEVLKQQLPDTKLHNLVDIFIKVKCMQALTIINHRIYPNKLNKSPSELIREDQAENTLEDTLKLVKKNITKRLNKLWNGAKYE